MIRIKSSYDKSYNDPHLWFDYPPSCAGAFKSVGIKRPFNIIVLKIFRYGARS